MVATPSHIKNSQTNVCTHSCTNSGFKKQLLKFVRIIYTNLFVLTLSGVLIYGWTHRESNYLTAETGTGYVLGIIGGSLMLILLLYPISKRVTLFTRWIPIRYWFGVHMWFGIFGPTMILFHSNFQLGSTNSTVALFCMLLVAISGLIGRYIYTHIHHGLYGTRISLNELKQNTQNDHTELLTMLNHNEKLNEHITKMEVKALKPYSNFIGDLLNVIYLGLNAKRLKLKIINSLKKSTNKSSIEKKEIINSVNHYTLALRQMAAFKLYEQLFSLWHILHLPLFIMMIITAVIHIFAVHLY